MKIIIAFILGFLLGVYAEDKINTSRDEKNFQRELMLRFVGE